MFTTLTLKWYQFWDIMCMCNVCSVFITHAVAHPSVFDDVVTVQNAKGVDLLLEILQG